MLEGGTVLLSGILNESANVDSPLDQDWDKYKSESNDGTNYDIEELAFVIDQGDDDVGDME